MLSPTRLVCAVHSMQPSPYFYGTLLYINVNNRPNHGCLDGTKTITTHTPNSVTARLPSNTLLSYELGDQLPGVESQMDVKRVIRLPGNVTHTTEWWHQLRNDDYRGIRDRGNTIVRRLLVSCI